MDAVAKVTEADGRSYRVRRGKLVAIPPEWVGKVTHPQTIAKRPSKHPHKRRKKLKLGERGLGSSMDLQTRRADAGRRVDDDG